MENNNEISNNEINNEITNNENATQKSTLEVSESTLREMASASKWVRFQVVLMSIAIACCLIAGIVMITAPRIDQIYYPGRPYGVSILTGILYILLSLIYLLPISYLLKNAKGLKQTSLTNDSEQFSVAMKNNKRYWKFLGILSIVLISICIIAVILVIIIGCSKGYTPMDLPELAI